MRLLSLEQNFGVVPQEILEGEEKWILKEGLTCVIQNTETKRTIARFTVPQSASTKAAHVEYPGMDVELPEY